MLVTVTLSQKSNAKMQHILDSKIYLIFTLSNLLSIFSDSYRLHNNKIKQYIASYLKEIYRNCNSILHLNMQIYDNMIFQDKSHFDNFKQDNVCFIHDWLFKPIEKRSSENKFDIKSWTFFLQFTSFAYCKCCILATCW